MLRIQQFDGVFQTRFVPNPSIGLHGLPTQWTHIHSPPDRRNLWPKKYCSIPILAMTLMTRSAWRICWHSRSVICLALRLNVSPLCGQAVQADRGIRYESGLKDAIKLLYSKHC